MAAEAGTVYVVTGGRGQSLYTGWQEPAPAWSAAREALYHVVLFRVTPDAIELEVLPTDGSDFRDAFRILRAPATSDGGVPAAEITNEVPGLALPMGLVILAGIALARRR